MLSSNVQIRMPTRLRGQLEGIACTVGIEPARLARIAVRDLVERVEGQGATDALFRELGSKAARDRRLSDANQ